LIEILNFSSIYLLTNTLYSRFDKSNDEKETNLLKMSYAKHSSKIYFNKYNEQLRLCLKKAPVLAE